jgi:prepilin-type N-terminal cleavage/methylation domain-containing protein
MQRTTKSSRGFTLVEMTISAAIGLALVAAAAQLYSKALNVSLATSQRAQMQQDFRAAANLLQRDISMAGAGALGQQGLANNAVGLPNTGIKPVYPCSTTTCNYIAGAPVAYPSSGAPLMYSIIPGPSFGITVNAAAGPTDIITIVSADVNLQLNCYSASIDSTGTVVTFTLPPVLPSTCVLPPGVAAPADINDVYVGLQKGDMVMFGTNAVGVVTNITSCGVGCGIVNFANGDPGHINQPGAPGTTGSLSQFVSTTIPTPASTPIAVASVRVLVVTYYLDISPSDGVTPRLMRIQNGKLPAPVAENVVYLKFTYDVIQNGTVTTNQATLPAGTSPNMITKVNVAHMSMRSQGRDNWSRSTLAQYGGYEGLDLQTSMAARNLTSLQEYPISAGSN